MQQGKDPQRTHPHYQSKYHCYIAYFEIFSLDGNLLHVLLGPAGRTTISFHPFLSFFYLFIFGGPANLCDSVATECLSAAECSAPQQPSPLLLAQCLPADPCRLASLLPPPTPAKSSSFRTGPPVLNLLLLLRQSLSSATSSVSVSCKDHFIQRWRCFTFHGFTYGFAIVCVCFIIILMSSWSLLILLPLSLVMQMIVFWWCWWFYGFLNIGFYAVFSFSPAPLTASEAAAACRLEVRFSCRNKAIQKANKQTLQIVLEKAGGFSGGPRQS